MSFPHRTICDAIEDCRRQNNNLDEYNYYRVQSNLKVLLEEIQSLANRMEAGLYYTQDLDKLHAKRKTLRLQVKELKSQLPKDNEDLEAQIRRATYDEIFGDE